MKKYNLRCAYCGSTIAKYEWLLKLRLIFTNRYRLNCPKCHHQTSWLYIFHLRHDMDQEEKQFNKQNNWDTRL